VYDELDHPELQGDRSRHLPEGDADDTVECPGGRERLVQVVDRAPVGAEPVRSTAAVAVAQSPRAAPSPLLRPRRTAGCRRRHGR
jgi:hypothetical protein